MREEALLIGSDHAVVGVFTPAADNAGGSSDMAAICITAGLLHHVGPHRMHVLLARALAKEGISTLRFDLSGIGDSAIRTDDLIANEVPVQEINDAINMLESRGFTRFILFGICSGAMRAAKAASGNSKIAGIILVNTGGDDGSAEVDTSPAAQLYLKRSLWNLSAWKNLVTGKVKYRALFYVLWSALIKKLKPVNKVSTSIEDLLRSKVELYSRQGTSILSVLSDRHAQIYELYQQVYDNLRSAQFKTLVYPNTDHLFTSLSQQQDLIDRICQWSAELAAANAETGSNPDAEMTG
jgi:alpha/beta superfamily hydrolase